MDVKIKKLTTVDQTKYKGQQGVRRIRESKGGFEHVVFATDQDL